ncbi:Uncharacterised protein [Mycobacteroides abscessus subsp. abscessus]|nr:Uncharacterised protein [Mycobacteroides abscessus subsp. abscessus]
MDCHLVTVKVGIVCCTYKRMETDCAPFNQCWFKGLDSEPVKSRCTVQQNWVLFDYLFKHIPYLRLDSFNFALC